MLKKILTKTTLTNSISFPFAKNVHAKTTKTIALSKNALIFR